MFIIKHSRIQIIWNVKKRNNSVTTIYIHVCVCFDFGHFGVHCNRNKNPLKRKGSSKEKKFASDLMKDLHIKFPISYWSEHTQ